MRTASDFAFRRAIEFIYEAIRGAVPCLPIKARQMPGIRVLGVEAQAR